MIKVGQKVRIDPFRNIRMSGMDNVHEIVDGTVHFVHPTNRWFNVEYTDHLGKRLVGFKFDDIGRAVQLVKG